MTRAVSFFGSTIGRKVVMALSGMVLFGFVIAHMAGNLQLYLGAHALNEYSVSLREVLHGAGLWIARAGLLAAVGLHIWAATSLALAERGARPEGYRSVRHRESTYASRTMMWSGPILLLFIVYHLLHLTLGTVHGSFIEGDVYHNVVAGFRVWPVSAFYIVAMLALGLHLRHGVWSMLQTLGLSHPRWNGLRAGFANLFALVVVAGNISMPVAVLAGLVK
jgi:succinate dehydrogenase / fumarate reductase, cytochrome b subunit